MTTNADRRNADNGGNEGRRVEKKKGGGSVQSRLTEATFANYLEGFAEVVPSDLVGGEGGRVRYVLEELDARGRVRARKYRLGGWLTAVDPGLRYLRLVNPYARKAWSVQLRAPDQRTRLYYTPPATSREIGAMRSLLTQLENGDIRIEQVRR